MAAADSLQVSNSIQLDKLIQWVIILAKYLSAIQLHSRRTFYTFWTHQCLELNYSTLNSVCPGDNNQCVQSVPRSVVVLYQNGGSL